MNRSKIKIAHVITRLIIGGAQENTLSTVIQLMKNKDYDVDLITGPGLGPEGSLENIAINNQVNMLIVPQMRRNIHPVRDVIAFFQILKIFRKQKYDIIHTHSSKAGIIGRLAAKLSGCPIIIHTIHGLPFHPYEKKWKNFVYIFLERICSKVSNCIITVSDTMRDKALEKKIGNINLYKTVYSGMRIDEFINCEKYRKSMRDKLNIKDDEIVVGKIARLFHLKGHDFIIDCACEIIKKAPETKFMFVGDGILKDDLMNRIKSYGIEKNFIFTGLVPPDKIPELISCMDILVHASLREGLARALPQALASGIPVVSLDIDSAHEVVKHGKNGYLVGSGDKEGFVVYLTQLIKNEKLRKTMGIEGRKIVVPFFDATYMVDQIEKIYKDFLVRCGR